MAPGVILENYRIHFSTFFQPGEIQWFKIGIDQWQGFSFWRFRSKLTLFAQASSSEESAIHRQPLSKVDRRWDSFEDQATGVGTPQLTRVTMDGPLQG
jgi:hypothetical protein